MLKQVMHRRLPQTRGFVTKALYNWSKGIMPVISETEKIALGCGTVGFDREIFIGSPSLKSLEKYQPKLSSKEVDFLKNEVDELCSLLNDHDVSLNKDFSYEAWEYMRSKKFFGLKIPTEYGGLGFSTCAVGTVLSKLASKCFDANATVAVPNSLGPGELLVRYGTQKQKEYFLPRLADGTMIPCFGLTGPHSGSDATSLIGSEGVVQERDGELGVLANFRKRYITLAPVAGVVGIGLNLKDPQGLLTEGREGFTVALLERDHQGLRMGPRHMPLNAAFMNGTVEGEDVWIPMHCILGDEKQCGNGWLMFVECLAEGRGVSLPSGSVGAARTVVSGVGAYARIRKQFRVPIAEFGGIQEAMAEAGSDGLITIAGGDLMNAIIDNHEAPMVISSIMKQNCTERGRRVIEKGMDIAAGSGICQGNKNYLGNVYMSLPIAITVEGANIMTRSFQIIGQGLTRCHPHMIDLVQCLMKKGEADADTLKIFKHSLKNIIRHGFTNFFQSISRGVKSSFSTAVRSKKDFSDGDKLLQYHEEQLLRLSANFALTADLCFTLGGRLKFEELLMGRMADCIGAIYLGYATLHHYKRRRGIEGLEALTEHAMLRLEHEAQTALLQASENFPGPKPISSFSTILMKLGLGFSNYKQPSDTLTKEVSKLLTTPSQIRDMFQENVYTTEHVHQVSDLIQALPVCVEADKVASTLRKEKRLPTTQEKDLLAKAEALRDVLVQVDVYQDLGEDVRPALVGTEERLQSFKHKSFMEFYSNDAQDERAEAL